VWPTLSIASTNFISASPHKHRLTGKQMLPYQDRAKKMCLLSVAAVSLAYPFTTANAYQPTPRNSRSTVSQQQKELGELRQRVKVLEEKLLKQSATPQNTASPGPLPAQKAPMLEAAVSVNEQQSRPAPPASRPGEPEMTIDEAAAQRALERTLTQIGVLLLPPGVVQVTPSTSYSLAERELSRLALVSSPPAPSSVSALTYRTRQTTTFAGLGLRVGLPMAMQLEASIAANRLSSKETNDFGQLDHERLTGRGDIAVAVAKTLFREKGWRPDLIGRVTYNFGSPRRQEQLGSLPGGFRQIQGELFMLKRQDPIAFTLGAVFAHPFEKDGLRPGNTTVASVGAAVAASPQTSLQVGFAQVRNSTVRIGGTEIPGSDQLYGIVTLGASSIVSARHTVIGQIGIGLGRDAPKYTASLSVPMNFH
jgi:hypothetical protein